MLNISMVIFRLSAERYNTGWALFAILASYDRDEARLSTERSSAIGSVSSPPKLSYSSSQTIVPYLRVSVGIVGRVTLVGGVTLLGVFVPGVDLFDEGSFGEF